MAKGNDGNLLQHAVETKIACELAGPADLPGLYLACTHAMQPFDPLERRHEKHVEGRRRFEAWWERATHQTHSEGVEPPILIAYRRCRAEDPLLYPNTAQMVSSLLGRNRVRSLLIDRNDGMRGYFDNWSLGRAIRVYLGKSWRDRLQSLHAPQDLDRPWLFTMDPMKYWPDNEKDDDDLHPNDVDRLASVVASFVTTGQPGVFAAFCYSMIGRTDRRSDFRRWAQKLAHQTAVHSVYLKFVDIAELGHIGALISRDPRLLETVHDHWTEIRDAELSTALTSARIRTAAPP